MRQGSSSAQFPGQSRQVPEGCGGRSGLWNEDSLFSGPAALRLPVPLRVSNNLFPGRQAGSKGGNSSGMLRTSGIGTVKPVLPCEALGPTPAEGT